MISKLFQHEGFNSIIKPLNKIASILLIILILFSAEGYGATMDEGVKYEAEDGTLYGVFATTVRDGFSGTGYIDEGSLNKDGDRIEITVDLTEGGAYLLYIGYGGFNGDKIQYVKINGVAANVTFPSTTGFEELEFGNITLQAGENTITLEKQWGYTSFDYIRLVDNNIPTCFYEAEDANLKKVETSFAIRGYSGTGHTDGESFNGDAEIEFIVDLDNAGDYWLRIRQYSDGAKDQYIKINNETAVITNFPGTDGTWGDFNYGKISLNAGKNTIKFTPIWGWTLFDYIDVTPYEQFTLDVVSGSGSGDYDLGSIVEIVASNATDGQVFDQWIGDVEYLDHTIFATTNITMPSKDVSITATYKTPAQYELTVTGGSGSGTYNEASGATIKADNPATGKVFNKWIGDTKGLDNFTKAETTYKITDMDATITATYRDDNNNTKMALGTNFWFYSSWSGEEPMISSESINWATAYENGDDVWNPVFIEELSIYKVLRFMDWGATNNNSFRYWDDRRLPADPDNHQSKNAFSNTPPSGHTTAGLSYEWMIDLCNRTNTDMWINVPHKAKKEFWDGLSVLIAENLNEGLKCYIEYSNETWNPGFTQNAWIINQGQGLKMPGSNKYYKGGSYHVYISYQIFDSFETSFNAAGKGNDLIKVIAMGGNIDPVVKAIRDNDPKVNPLGQKADAISIAAYIGGHVNFGEELDGDDPLILQKANEWLKNELSPSGGNPGVPVGRVYRAREIADEFGMLCIAYEGGTHVLKHAETWS
ncbi:MAG: hypothetical protein KAG37_06850, partial [Flavobacteriales bacterium]|nr:hypothetical protein [Flavobacteriales bacterium]